jgi:leucyl/phenylalanyl-tRNA--protein transferase
VPRLALISPGDPPEAFPDPAEALPDPPGLLCIGGDLSPGRLLAAYRRGIFPWFEAGQPILWWSPDPRAVLYTNELRVSRSLRRTLRSGRYRVSIDADFGGVIHGCAAAPGRDETWITPAMHAAYRELHALGHAHSVETWEDGELVGGLYGVSIGRAFFGESMFATRPDASKVALVRLVRHLADLGAPLVDCQVASSHLASLGSRTVPREAFLAELEPLVAGSPGTLGWPSPPIDTHDLAGVPGATPLRG